MRTLVFATRNIKEILRDPLNLSFGLGLPLILLLVMSVIQANIPIEIFTITQLAPGIAVFGLSFLTLFVGQMVAKDRESAFLLRLYTSPLKPTDYIFGYMLPLLPIALVQALLCYILSFAFKLPININLLYALGAIIPIAIFFISLGLLFGSILNVKAVGGICGALVTNLTALLSGIWIDLELFGEGFKSFLNVLPFVHLVELEKCVLNATYEGALVHFIWVLCYGIITTIIATLLFLNQMKQR